MTDLAPLSPTTRSTVHRLPERGRTDRAELYDLLDSCLVCHLGIVVDGASLVLPTGFGRDGDTLYLHGSTGAASLRAASNGGIPVCVTITRVDGIVYGRSVFHHSMNYTSAVIQGTAVPVLDPDAKRHALHAVTEHLAPGSWTATRQPSRKELAATAVLAVPLHEASVKRRNGPPKDEPEDYAADVADWAGVLPVRQTWAEPETDPELAVGTTVPVRVTRRAPG